MGLGAQGGAGLRKGSEETGSGGAEEHAFDIAVRGFPVLCFTTVRNAPLAV